MLLFRASADYLALIGEDPFRADRLPLNIHEREELERRLEAQVRHHLCSAVSLCQGREGPTLSSLPTSCLGSSSRPRTSSPARSARKPSAAPGGTPTAPPEPLLPPLPPLPQLLVVAVATVATVVVVVVATVATGATATMVVIEAARAATAVDLATSPFQTDARVRAAGIALRFESAVATQGAPPVALATATAKGVAAAGTLGGTREISMAANPGRRLVPGPVSDIPRARSMGVVKAAQFMPAVSATAPVAEQKRPQVKKLIAKMAPSKHQLATKKKAGLEHSGARWDHLRCPFFTASPFRRCSKGPFILAPKAALRAQGAPTIPNRRKLLATSNTSQ